MAEEYDPTACEQGICGPCEACIERDNQRVRDELGDEIPEHRQLIREANDLYLELGMSGPVTEKTPIGTIDLTPSWVTVVRIYLEVIADPGRRGTQAVSDAKGEILRAAKLADLYVKEHER
jgi:hypothetical protein